MSMLWLLVVSALGVLYPYFIYPALLAVVSRGRTRSIPVAAPQAPKVAILVSAFQEESRIADKIANFDALRYPPDRLEMWIGVDGATDRTAHVVRAIGHSRVHLVERSQRSGKTAVLNDLAARASADIFVFTDVNAFFRPDVVERLAAAMADPKAGVVSGRTVIRSGAGNVEVEGAYYRLESLLKALEGRRGWLAGADGAIYALRASLYRPLPLELINDLAHPCEVTASGYKAMLDPLAISEEHAGEDAGREFQRQTRMTAQASYLLAALSPALLRNGRWGMLWVLVSHKWLRWIMAVWFITGALALAALSPLSGVAALALFVVLLAGWMRNAGWASMPVYFVLIHFAYLRGLWQAMRGERYVVWKPRAG